MDNTKIDKYVSMILQDFRDGLNDDKVRDNFMVALAEAIVQKRGLEHQTMTIAALITQASTKSDIDCIINNECISNYALKLQGALKLRFPLDHLKVEEMFTCIANMIKEPCNRCKCLDKQHVYELLNSLPWTHRACNCEQ
jgi:hypothetical protein